MSEQACEQVIILSQTIIDVINLSTEVSKTINNDNFLPCESATLIHHV